MTDQKIEVVVDKEGHAKIPRAHSNELLLGIIISIMGCVALIFGAITYLSYKDLVVLKAKETEFEELKGEIDRLDEVLTMSAKMGAATGDLLWEKRYHQNEPILLSTINTFLQKFPEISMAKETESANLKLVNLEKQSFDLVRKNQKTKAYALLTSEEFQNQKIIYNLGMRISAKIIKRELAHKQSAAQFKSTSVAIFAVVFMVFSLMGWAVLFKRLRQVNLNLREFSSTLENQVKIQALHLVQKSKLESLGQLSADIAHEINNPLAIIEGAASLLPKFLNDPEKLNLKVQIIIKNCERISKIIAGLKKFSRLGDKTPFSHHSLNAMAKEAIHLTDLKSKRYSTPVTLEFKTMLEIFCNEIEIEQVLVNLLSNAIDAVKNKTEKWVKVLIFEDQGVAVLQVTDSGNGIPENDRIKLFDPFFTTKAVGEGTGLGLSITKGILDQHKATIEVLAHCPNTCFEIRFQKEKNLKNAA